MQLKFLGTGTSTGVPQLRCDCKACTSTDPRDKRMRCSALVTCRNRNILIDCGPDFRTQMLQFHKGDIDALLVTHHHYDHVGGADDLRPYCKGKDAFPIWCLPQTADDLHRRMPYCFVEKPYPGVPRFEIHELEPLHPVEVNGIEVLPLPVNHYMLEILGFKIGQLAYITDAKHIPQETIDAIKGVDTLVINALRRETHLSHITLAEALEFVHRIKPRVAYLTHLSHDMGLTSDLELELPPNVFPAVDGLTITIPDPE